MYLIAPKDDAGQLDDQTFEKKSGASEVTT
jgi:hypothetical protein